MRATPAEAAAAPSADGRVSACICGRDGDGHRALALAVELVELVAQQIERALEVGDVHRRAAVGDDLSAARVGRAGAAVLDQALHHGGREEDADVAGQRFSARTRARDSNLPLSGKTLCEPRAMWAKPTGPSRG